MNTAQQVQMFSADFEHKHYTGDAKEYEILEELDGKAGFYIKIFFISDKVNLNKWQVTWDGIKQDMNDVLGVPIVLQDDMRHPNFHVQNMFAKGYIVDYQMDEAKHEVYVIARILDAATIVAIKEGKIRFSSPAIVARDSLSIEVTAKGVDLLSRFIALHLALVADPAYGKTRAKIFGTCTGTGTMCNAKLKRLTAAVCTALYSAGDCVSDKIPIIMQENPKMSHDQATAIAVSMCKEKNADSIDSLTQIPLITKELRAASEMQQIQWHASKALFEGEWGYFMTVREKNVFVADGSTVDESIKKYCGCSKIH